MLQLTQQPFFFQLKFNNINLKQNLGEILELESGSNDPTAYVLVLIFISVVTAQSGQSILGYLTFFIVQMALGAICGLFFGYLTKLFIDHLDLRIEELYAVILIGVLFLTFSLTNLIHGNGFLAIYILGMIIRSRKYSFLNRNLKFMSSMSWLMQLMLFVTLGLLVFPTHLSHTYIDGFALAFILVLIIRPLSVFGSMIFFGRKLDVKSKLFLSLGGLKGAVPIVFAIFVRTANVPNSKLIFNLIFFVVLVSVLIQGTTLGLVAKLLKLNKVNKNYLKENSEPEELDYLEEQLLEIKVHNESSLVGKELYQLDLPVGCLIVLIKRNGNYIHPSGQTGIMSGDTIIVMYHNKDEFIDYFNSIQNNDVASSVV